MRQRPSSLIPLATALPILLVSLATAAAAQVFRGAEDVTLVEVPVQVLRDGQPVTGLGLENFEIVEGRKKQQILELEVFDLTRLEAGTSGGASAALPAMARRHFLFFFDLSFSEPASLAKAQDAALALAAQGLHPTDLAAVGTYSTNRGARLVLGFTSDRRQLELAIQTLGAPELVDRTADPLGLVLGTATARLTDALESGGGGGGAGGRAASAVAAAVYGFTRTYENAQARTTAENQRTRISAMSRSFEELAGVLRQVQGRKQVLYFSEGFDSGLMMASGEDKEDARAAELGEIWEVDTDNVFGSTKVQSDLGAMLDAFEQADCVIQAIDIGGVRADSSVQAVHVANQRIDASALPDRTVGQDGLFFMANETGGELFRNFNDLSTAMGRVLERTSVTYLLTFQPKDLRPDGSYHPIEVRLKNVPKAKVSHRPGYFAPTPWSQRSKIEQRLTNADLILGTEDAGGVIRTAAAAAALDRPGAAAVVPLVVEIDGSSLLEGHYGNLLNAEIHVYAIDQDGVVRDFLNQMVGLNLAKNREALEHGGLKFYGDLELPAGRYRLRTLVRNNQASTYGTATARVTVGDAHAGAPMLVVEAPSSWIMLREDAGRASIPYPFAAGTDLWIADPHAELRSDAETSLWLEAVPHGKETPSLFATVATAAGTGEREVEARVVAREAGSLDGLERMLVRVTPSGLGPGEYVLAVTVTDPAGGSFTSRLPVVVR